MELSELLVLPEVFLVELEPLAPHFEEVKDPHLVYELSGVVGVEQYILS